MPNPPPRPPKRPPNWPPTPGTRPTPAPGVPIPPAATSSDAPIAPLVRPALIPKQLVWAAGTVASVLAAGAASTVDMDVPPYMPYAMSTLAGIAAFLAGQGLPGIVIPGRPLVPIALVPVLLSVATATGTMAAMSEDPWWKGGLLLLSTVLAGAAGKASPQVK